MMARLNPSVFRVVLFACLPLVTVVIAAPEFQFSFGRIQGSDKLAVETQKPYNAYYGIPFAEAPVGQLRFRPPRPYAGRDPNVVISSSTFRSACYQNQESTQLPISEDCLYLNIFKPVSTSGLKKVMIWIHGGGYRIGEAISYKPSRMVTDNDVIVVTIQYRLGPLGFLSAAKEGNNALRDQIMAIQWVKDNIRQFGGDPDDITIFGESAGAGSVSLLSISPLTKGLFTKVIMQSGTALTFWSNDKDNENRLYEMAYKLGCTFSWYFFGWLSKESYRADVLNCLRTKTAVEIDRKDEPIQLPSDDGKLDQRAKGEDEDKMLEQGLTGSLTYAPFVDGMVIPRDPRSLMADRAYLQSVGALDREYIVGCTNNEALIAASLIVALGQVESITRPKAAAKYLKTTADFLFPLSTSQNKEALELLEYAYAYPRESSGNAPLQGLLDATSDVQFVLPTVQFARLMTKASAQTNVFMYLFDHYPETIATDSVFKGSSHSVDISYEFDLEPVMETFNPFYIIPSPSDGNLAEIFRGLLTSFAKTGNPSWSNQGSTSFWPRYDPQQEFYLAISPSPEVRQHMYAKRVSLWTDFLFKKGGVFYRG